MLKYSILPDVRQFQYFRPPDDSEQADKRIVLFAIPAVLILIKVIYIGTMLLQKDDPRFEGDKIIYRS